MRNTKFITNNQICYKLRTQLLAYSNDIARQLKAKDEEIALLRGIDYRPTIDIDSGSGSQFDYQYPPCQYPSQSSA